MNVDSLVIFVFTMLMVGLVVDAVLIPMLMRLEQLHMEIFY